MRHEQLSEEVTSKNCIKQFFLKYDVMQCQLNGNIAYVIIRII